tara:strand:+ start:17037 stop:17960 length:924 start_codon:yes stop_codon:yes gene_type:complete
MANTTNFSIETPTVGGYRNTWGGTINTGLSRIDELLALAMPIGTIQMFPKTTAPTATANGGTWLICKGQTLTRTDYPALHTLLTTTYGAYPSGSTFVLPDMRTRVPLGYSADTIGSGDAQRTPKAIAATGGEERHTLTEGELKGHSHSIPTTTHTHTYTTGGNTSLDAETNLAQAKVTLNDHSHTTYRFTDYLANVVGGAGNEGTSHGGAGKSETMIRYLDNWRTDASSTSSVQSGAALVGNDGDSNNGHKHTIPDNGHTHAGTTAAGVTNITSTGSTGTANGAQHENLPPYVVVNYIILAKHPTFT